MVGRSTWLRRDCFSRSVTHKLRPEDEKLRMKKRKFQVESTYLPSLHAETRLHDNFPVPRVLLPFWILSSMKNFKIML